MPLGTLKKEQLTKQEEINLVRRSQTKCDCLGDPTLDCDACKCRSILIEFNLRWLFKLCVNHSSYVSHLGITAEEFMADAIQGFTNALCDFDYREPERLITYSTKPVISALLASDLTTGIIVIPVWVRQLKRRIEKISTEARNFGIELTLDEIAIKVNQSKTTVENVLSVVECELGFTTLPSKNNYDDHHEDEKSHNFSSAAWSYHSDSEDWMHISDIKYLMHCLTDEEKSILSAKFGIDQEKLAGPEIERKFGFGRRKIKKIYDTALEKMRSEAGV